MAILSLPNERSTCGRVAEDHVLLKEQLQVPQIVSLNLCVRTCFVVETVSGSFFRGAFEERRGMTPQQIGGSTRVLPFRAELNRLTGM